MFLQKDAVSLNQLSFGDEEAEFGEADGMQGGMGAATDKRFRKESAQQVNATVAATTTHQLQDYVGSAMLPGVERRKRLGSIIFGSSRSPGKKSYMEDRDCMIPSFGELITGEPPTPAPTCYAGVFDGHNGAAAAEVRVGLRIGQIRYIYICYISLYESLCARLWHSNFIVILRGVLPP